MSRRARPGGNDLRSNLTPMIDVVFQLIIFFMVVAQITRQRSVELTPPMIESGHHGRDDPKKPAVVIHVVPGAPAGAYRLDDETFDASPDGLAALSRRVAAALVGRDDVSVRVRADRLEAYERVRPAIDAARAGGASEVGLVTTKPGES